MAELTKPEYERILALEAFGEPKLPPGFDIDEIVVPGTHNRRMPPREKAKQFAIPLRHCYAIRERHASACRDIGLPFRGIYMKAAYRPYGGATKSKHKALLPWEGAFDICVKLKDWSAEPQVKQVFYEVGAVYYWEQVQLYVRGITQIGMGLGMYCAPGKTAGVQLHVDSRKTPALFQITGKATPVKPACGYQILRRLGYDV